MTNPLAKENKLVWLCEGNFRKEKRVFHNSTHLSRYKLTCGLSSGTISSILQPAKHAEKYMTSLEPHTGSKVGSH